MPRKRRGRKSGGRGFKYTLADLDCRYCLENKECLAEFLCLHILDNLPDLMLDPKFLLAVENAGQCTTPLKETLLYLRNQNNKRSEVDA